jgi:hypothetical protein
VRAPAPLGQRELTSCEGRQLPGGRPRIQAGFASLARTGDVARHPVPAVRSGPAAGARRRRAGPLVACGMPGRACAGPAPGGGPPYGEEQALGDADAGEAGGGHWVTAGSGRVIVAAAPQTTDRIYALTDRRLDLLIDRRVLPPSLSDDGRLTFTEVHYPDGPYCDPRFSIVVRNLETGEERTLYESKLPWEGRIGVLAVPWHGSRVTSTIGVAVSPSSSRAAITVRENLDCRSLGSTPGGEMGSWRWWMTGLVRIVATFSTQLRESGGRCLLDGSAWTGRPMARRFWLCTAAPLVS